jgi:murein DD-endopeptidase MepM/ murein hydrolase activator NlpD
MLDVRVLFRTTHGRRFLGAIAMVAAGIAARHAWQAERQSAALRDEVKWLRTRLADKRDVIARQRQEMARVASAVDHLARTTSALGERAAQARRLARLEQSRADTPAIVSISATLDGGFSIESEDAGHALEALAWLEGQASAASDSLVVLTALLKQRETDAQQSVPTVWPVRGFVTSPFGARISPYGEGREMHPGIDISARYGLPVTAPGGGQVIFAGRDSGYGGLVIIDHGGELDTLYGHLSALYVREGQAVRRGQVLGAIGATGRATGAHLHYEVRVNGTPVDPRRYLVN